MLKFFPIKGKGIFAKNDDELMKLIQQGDAGVTVADPSLNPLMLTGLT